MDSSNSPTTPHRVAGLIQSSPMKISENAAAVAAAAAAGAGGSTLSSLHGFNPIGSMFPPSAASTALHHHGGSPGNGDFMSGLGNHPALAQWLHQQAASAANAANSAGISAPHSPVKDEPMSPRQGSTNSGGSEYAAL